MTTKQEKRIYRQGIIDTLEVIGFVLCWTGIILCGIMR